VPDVELSQAFDDSVRQLDQLDRIWLSRIADKTYSPGKWTVKDIIQHLIDAERIMAYRALLFARGTPSVEGFERFVDYAHRRRSQGEFACFAVVPEGLDTAVGIFQLRALDAGFSTAEWGFALGSAFWGRGLFRQGAELLLAFAFDQMGVNRLEARAMASNDRGNGALRKMGARKEGVLRQAMAKGGCLHDAHLWAIVETDWRQANGVWRPADDRIIRTPRLSESMETWEGLVH